MQTCCEVFFFYTVQHRTGPECQTSSTPQHNCILYRIKAATTRPTNHRLSVVSEKEMTQEKEKTVEACLSSLKSSQLSCDLVFRPKHPQYNLKSNVGREIEPQNCNRNHRQKNVFCNLRNYNYYIFKRAQTNRPAALTDSYTLLSKFYFIHVCCVESLQSMLT